LSKVRANGIDLEIEDTGADGSQAGRTAVVLVMGLGLQLLAWPPALVQALVDAGYRVIRFDNRDVGLSQHFDHLGVPNLLWEGLKHHVGLPVRAPYRLHDMAADVLGLLDALHIERAHVVGVSMGGMVAQRLALAAPQRVRSLTSVMSSSGARYLPAASMKVQQALLRRPDGDDVNAIVEHYMRLFRLIGSPAYPVDDAPLRQRIEASVRRSHHPEGTMRQIAAVAADVTRADELPRLSAPTLVVHGLADPLIPFACGQDTARRIPGARLAAIPGMGHDLPPGVVEQVLRHLLPHLQSTSHD
jgi:pimeloyl-ACP methyl ester carboxylesterase